MMECGMEQHQHVIVSKRTAKLMYKNVIMLFVRHFSCYTAEELISVKQCNTDIILNNII